MGQPTRLSYVLGINVGMTQLYDGQKEKTKGSTYYILFAK